MKYEAIDYDSLDGKQKEAYNYQKISAVLADFGYVTVLLSTDWNGADFLAVHLDGHVEKIQLKGRMTFDKKYLNKDLHVCFRDETDWYIYPHDSTFAQLEAKVRFSDSKSWQDEGKYSFPRLSEAHRQILAPYRIPNLPRVHTNINQSA